jgi:CRP/FNR family transcriptional regulator
VHPDVERALAASFWSKLPREPVEAMFAEGIRLEATAGLIVTEDQARSQVALVLSGLFRMFARAKSGRQVTVAYAREGDMIGLVAALAGHCRNGMQAMSAASVWVLPAETLKRHARANPDMAMALAEENARANVEMLNELADTAFGTVRQRVARHLLDLVVEGPDNGPLLAPVSQQELANAVGTVREVVSRVLTVLSKEGLVRATQAGLEVLDATQLYEQSQVTD